jgi:hypothetical protein
VASALVTISSAVSHLVGLVSLPVHDVWIPAVVLSVVFLGAASMLERRRDRVARLWLRLENHFTRRVEGANRSLEDPLS